jgi:hypothetical protein
MMPATLRPTGQPATKPPHINGGVSLVLAEKTVGIEAEHT